LASLAKPSIFIIGKSILPSERMYERILEVKLQKGEMVVSLQGLGAKTN
jgi:hypothetical protein